jgi:hypothetical protein
MSLNIIPVIDNYSNNTIKDIKKYFSEKIDNTISVKPFKNNNELIIK